jgi:adenosylhomocysteine nucleosidase
MICFVIAMDSEAKPVLANMTDTNCTIVHDKKIYKGNLCERQCAVVVCGVGKVNAAAGAQYAIDVLSADTIVNIGVAGGLNDSLKVGNIYNISHVVQYDFDLIQLNHTLIGTLNEFEEQYLALDTCKLYPAKRLATGDRFNDSVVDFNLLTKTLNADIRDMECGAIVQVCKHAKVKCYSFKAISDLAGSGSTTQQFVNNMNLCAANLQAAIKDIFKEI